LRARMRQEVFPLLLRLNPRVVEHICALADRAAESSGTGGVGSGPTPKKLGVG
jgi:hypothetical protein